MTVAIDKAIMMKSTEELMGARQRHAADTALYVSLCVSFLCECSFHFSSHHVKVCRFSAVHHAEAASLSQ
jgi:hypothetical protein